jgi:hypothetical protein
MSQGVLISPDVGKVKMRVMGICRKCKHYHPVEGITPDLFGKAAFDWEYRHRLCALELPGAVEFLSSARIFPKGFDDRVYEAAGQGPQWLEWKANANVTVAYIADAALTFDLTALASSATFTAGRESTKVTNSSNYLDCGISGNFISGTTPTVPAEARLYYVRPTEDTPTWPDVFDGTDSAETVTNAQILDTLPLAWSGLASATSNVTYPVVNALTLAQAFGYVPKDFVLFFSHAHTAALKTDANNTNQFFYQFIQAAIA